MAVPQAPLVSPVLANVAPLQMNMPGMGMQPLNYQTPSTAASAGVASAVGAIGKGIAAIYQNKQQTDRFKAQQEQAKEEKQATRDEQKLRLQSTIREQDLRLAETARHNKEIEQAARDRIDKATSGDDDNAAFDVQSVLDRVKSRGSQESQTPEAPTQQTPPSKPVPEEYNPASSSFYLRNAAPIEIKKDVGSAASPQPNLAAINSLDTTNLFAPTTIQYVSASGTGGPGQVADVPSAVHQPLVNTAPVPMPNLTSYYEKRNLPALYQLNSDAVKAGLELQNAVEGGAYQKSEPGPATQPAQTETEAATGANEGYKVRPSAQGFQPEPAFEELMGVTGPFNQNQAVAIRDYAIAGGYPVPILGKKDKNGNVPLTWASPESVMTQQAAAAARKQHQGELADLGKERLNLREYNTSVGGFNSAISDFEKDPLVKDVEDKMHPAAVRFFGDYAQLAQIKDPKQFEHTGPLAQNLADQYVRFATGGVPTHAQYEQLTSNRSLWDRIKTQAARTTGTNDTPMLSLEDFKEMAKTYGKAMNLAHDELNTKIDDNKSYVEGLKTLKDAVTEHNKPHRYPTLKFEDDYKKEDDQSYSDMQKAWGSSKNTQPDDPVAYAEASKRNAEAKLNMKMAQKSNGMPVNFEDFRRLGEMVNGKYYPSGWRGRLIPDIVPSSFQNQGQSDVGQR